MYQGKMLTAIVTMGIVVGGITYLNRPLRDDVKLADTITALNAGDLHEAVDELNNQTRVDKLVDELGDLVETEPASGDNSPTPAVHY